ncbi:MAG: peroxiredoxin family protein [Flavobacteriales bacterium]
MLTRIHPFTSLGLLLALVAPFLFLAGLHTVGLGLVFLAYGFTLLEFKKYTSDFQFGMLIACSAFLGIALDLLFSNWPVLTFAMLICGFATVARQAWMQRFTYVNLLWVEPLFLLVAAVLIGSSLWGRPFQWELWALPALPFGAGCVLTCSYVQDGVLIKRNVRFGYRIQPGRLAPDFELPDQDGSPIKLSSYKDKHPVLLIFVRGDWCPGCHMMLRTYERNHERFLEKGIHVIAVGPDNIAVNKDMVRRIGVGYRLLSDHRQEVSGRYGVVYNNPLIEKMGVDYATGIPLPASFLVDKDGMVRYVSRPDRVGEFLDPELIFNVLEELPNAAPAPWNLQQA